MSKEKAYKINIPELLWHGGGNEHGKPDPVYSVDMHPTESILLTSGIDANVPPKGSVRLWKVNLEDDGQEFLVDLCDHQSVVNIARFSPCGRLLASASEKQILIYTLPPNLRWEDVTEVRQLGRMFVCPSLSEIYDLDWAPDSSHIVIGALEGKAEIVRVAQRDSVIVPGHTSYVQGVSWDPLNKMIATFSCDRSCKIHQLKTKDGQTTKLANRGHAMIKMHNGFMQNVEIKASSGDGKEKDALEQQMEQVVKGINLFADSTVPSFFRRLSFSPDGALLVIPTGTHRHLKAATPTSSNNINAASRTYATHVFVRDFWQTPAISLLGLDDPSVGVRFCPKPFQLLPSTEPPLFQASYRWLYAVITISSIFIYDTQHAHPLFKVAGIHYAAINDVAWTADGRMLVVCSSDGYLTFVRFAGNALGEVLIEEKVPEVIKRSHPALYPLSEQEIADKEAARVAQNKKQADAESNPTASTTVTAVSQLDTSNNDVAMDVDDDNNNDAGVTASLASTIPNSASEECKSPSKTTDNAVGVNNVAIDTAAISMDDSLLKKRKRIQPVQIAPLSSSMSPQPVNVTVAATPTTSSVSDKNIIMDISEPVEESKQSLSTSVSPNDASNKAVMVSPSIPPLASNSSSAQKKRIAPTLVAVSSSSTSSSSSSSSLPSSAMKF